MTKPQAYSGSCIAINKCIDNVYLKKNKRTYLRINFLLLVDYKPDPLKSNSMKCLTSRLRFLSSSQLFFAVNLMRSWDLMCLIQTEYQIIPKCLLVGNTIQSTIG